MLEELTKRALELQEAFRRSEEKSGSRWTRADLVRGFVGDVGALTKLTMAADGVRTIPGFREKLGHEFADCLWSLLVLAKEYDVDLEREFDRLVDETSAKLSANSSPIS